MEHCGIDLHDRNNEVCIVGGDGEVMESTCVSTKRTALRRFFSGRPAMRLAKEACGFSPWVSRLIAKGGHEVVVRRRSDVVGR